MEIKLATKLDIQDIMELIELCIIDLEGQSIYQWNDYYPTEVHIKESVEDNTLLTY